MSEDQILDQPATSGTDIKHTRPFLQVLVSLVVILASTTSFLAYQNMQLKKQIAVLKISPTPQTTPTPLNPEVNWQIFTDKSNRFSFQFPSNIKLDESKGTLSLIIDGHNVQINPDGPHQWGESMSKDQVDKIYMKIFQYPDNPNLKMYPDAAVLFYIEFDSIEEKNKSKKTTDILDQILSTFKFLDTEKTTTTYTCPANGWQNCMPILSEEGKKACSEEAMAWYKDNCPNFQGGAL